jgi:hypothetical protein
MERFSETQYWFVVAAVVLTPMLTLWIIEVIGWFLRRAFWRHPETAPRSGPEPARGEPAGVAAPPLREAPLRGRNFPFSGLPCCSAPRWRC